MSNWQETVLKPRELIRLEDFAETNTDIEASLIKQAEISFKAGKIQGATEERARMNRWFANSLANKEICQLSEPQDVCGECGGTGKGKQTPENTSVEILCSVCGGSGRKYVSGDVIPCPVCHGKKPKYNTGYNEDCINIQRNWTTDIPGVYCGQGDDTLHHSCILSRLTKENLPPNYDPDQFVCPANCVGYKTVKEK